MLTALQARQRGAHLLARHSVLVVDPMDETQEVLRTALGSAVDVLAARSSAEALALARRYQPNLVVLDLECDERSASLLGRFCGAAAAQPTPTLLLAGSRQPAARLPNCEILPKPYHYAPLIRRIEELLGGSIGEACQPARMAA
jgi:CheY-like chemotaxis protein